MGELYLEYEYWFAAMQLAFAMLGMGATLTLNDFKQVIHSPAAISIGFIIQLLMVPFVAFIFISVFGAVGGFAVGLALLAAIPGGTTSNIFTFFAKGNIPLSISITGITTIACLVTTPLILSLLIVEYLPVDFTMPYSQIVSDILLTLLLPLALGMIFLVKFPNYAFTLSKWSIRLSLLGIFIIVIGSISAGRLDLEEFGMRNVALSCVFISVLWLSTYLLSKLFGLTESNRTAIEMEVVVRNVNLGILIKASMFPIASSSAQTNAIGDIVLFTILLYGAVQMLIAAVLIFYRRLFF